MLYVDLKVAFDDIAEAVQTSGDPCVNINYDKYSSISQFFLFNDTAYRSSNLNDSGTTTVFTSDVSDPNTTLNFSVVTNNYDHSSSRW